MADDRGKGKDTQKLVKLEDLCTNYNTLQKELQELEVINSELDSVKKRNNIYVKKSGGNLFFLDLNRQKTVSEYKRLLALKQKEIKKVEEAIREQSCR